MHNLFYFISILTFDYAYTEELRNVPGSDFCFESVEPSEPKLEVALVIDQSSRAIQSRMNVLQGIVTTAHDYWPGSKVGFATFADYPCENFHPPDKCKQGVDSQEAPDSNGTFEKYHKDPQGCYKFHEALSSDKKYIEDRITEKNIEYLPSGLGESGLAGIYRTVAEPKMKWTRGKNLDENLIRIIVVASDDTTHSGKSSKPEAASKLELKGDGTDECATMHNPSPEQIGELMEKDDMAIYMLISDAAYLTGKDALKSWTRALKETGRFHRINKLDSRQPSKDFYNFVTDIKNSQYLTCADPPAYNTLGL